MLNDFMPIKREFKADGTHGEITIVPIADVHYGAREFNQKRWDEAIKRISEDPNCYAVLVGDLCDNGIRNSVTNIYEQTCPPSEQKRWLASELAKIKDKILAAVGGNHEKRSVRETDSDPLYDVMIRLGIEDVYRSRIAFLYVRILYEKTDHQKGTYALAITHGAGGGMYIGAGANRAANYGVYIDGIDCLVTGHTHKPITFPVSKLEFDDHYLTVRQKQFVVVTASSFLDYGGYAVDKMLPPTGHALTEIKLCYNGLDEPIIRVVQ